MAETNIQTNPFNTTLYDNSFPKKLTEGSLRWLCYGDMIDAILPFFLSGHLALSRKVRVIPPNLFCSDC